MTEYKTAATRRQFFQMAIGAGLWLASVDGFPAWAQADDATEGMGVKITNDAAMLYSGYYGASVSLTNAHIDVYTPGGAYHMSPTILYDSAWTTPTTAVIPPNVNRSANSIEITVTCPVADNRQMCVSLTVYRDIPGVYVITRLQNMGKLRSEYYYWTWDGSYTSYFAPQEDVIVERHPDPTTLDRFGYNDWVYLPEQTGGLALFTKQVLGRGSKDDKTTYLNSLPINQYIGPNQSMDMGIGFVRVNSPAEARQLYAMLAAKALPALNVETTIPNLESIDYGQPAPQWLQGTNKYNCWPSGINGVPADWSGPALAHDMHPFRFISHIPNDKDIIDRSHKAGLRAIMYLNFMEILNAEMQRQVGPNGASYLNGNWGKIVDHENMDIGLHQNWISYDDKGNARQSAWGAEQNIPGLFNTCLHQMDLHDAVIQQVKDILDTGVDGIFIDNAGPIPDCYGNKFNKHQHASPDKTNTEMYDVLMQRVYDTVKSVDKDKVVVINSGINPNQWAYSDAQMWEACLYGSGVVARTSTWEDARYLGEMQAEAVRRGKVPIILCYFDAQPIPTRNDRVLYTYAYARLYDLGWSDWFSMVGKDGDTKDALDVYDAQLGDGVGSVAVTDHVYHRTFEKGIALVNPDLWSKTVTVSVPHNGTLYDVCHSNKISATNKTVTVELAAESGRVLIWT